MENLKENLPPQEPVVQPVNKQSKQSIFLPVSILVAAALISGTVLYSNGSLPILGSIGNKGQSDNVKITVSKSDHILGNEKAKVTIVEYSDFQCPFCRIFWQDTFSKIKSQYIDTGKVRLIYRHFPLDIHPMSEPSAQASECAGEQGKFWEFHDKIFQEQAKLGQGTIQFTKQNIKKWTSQIAGVDTAKFNSCLDTAKYASRVSQDVEYANSINVTGTPTFFINGNRLVGAQPFAAFQSAIEKEL